MEKDSIVAIREKNKGSILLIKGIDVSVPSEYLDDSSSVNSENFEVNQGILSKRSGTIKLGDVIGGTKSYLEVMAGRFFTREDVSYNIRIGKEKIESYNIISSAWDDITGVDLTGGNTDIVNTAIPLLAGKTILCITNGKDAIRKWTATGDTTTLGGSPPVARFIQEYKTYLVGANIGGGVDITQRVQWSNTADPEEWVTGNAGAVDLIEDGDDITGLSLFGDYICVHKEKSIYLGYLVSSDIIFRFDRKATGVGTIANNSIQNLPTGEQIFLARDGIYLFNGINCRSLSPAITEEIRDTINSEYVSKTWSCLLRAKKEVWMGIPVGSNEYGEVVYKYNYETGIILKDIRKDMNAAWEGIISETMTWDDALDTWDGQTIRWDDLSLTNRFHSVIVSDKNGYSYEVSGMVNNDDNVAVRAVWETKDYQDSQQRMARFNKLELWAKGGSVKVQYSVDEGDTWSDMIDSPKTLSDKYPSFDSPDIFYFDVVASKVRFRFTNDNLNETLAIKQFIISYFPREIRH